jgi:hypothetical protein
MYHPDVHGLPAARLQARESTDVEGAVSVMRSASPAGPQDGAPVDHDQQLTRF